MGGSRRGDVGRNVEKDLSFFSSLGSLGEGTWEGLGEGTSRQGSPKKSCREGSNPQLWAGSKKKARALPTEL